MAWELSPTGSFQGAVQSGQIDQNGAGLQELEAAVNAARSGDLLELHIATPFVLPEWAGPFKIVDAIFAAISPFVRVRGVSISGAELIIVWEA